MEGESANVNQHHEENRSRDITAKTHDAYPTGLTRGNHAATAGPKKKLRRCHEAMAREENGLKDPRQAGTSCSREQKKNYTAMTSEAGAKEGQSKKTKEEIRRGYAGVP